MVFNNVILLVSDSLRRDFVGVYSKQNRKLTPFLNELARDPQTVVFDNAYSQGISTAPSMTCVLTGTYPLSYGGHWYIDKNRKTIAEMLKEKGYSTIAIHSNPNVSRLRNFQKGFDIFEENLTPFQIDFFVKYFSQKNVNRINKLFRMVKSQPYLNARDLNAKILSRLKEKKRPFFLWTQYMDTHGPYLKNKSILAYGEKIKSELLWNKAAVKSPENITRSEHDKLMENYKAEIKYTDKEIMNLIRQLKKTGDFQNSIIIVTADHGDEFGEHGMYGHSNKPYQELVRVPLIIKFPSNVSVKNNKVSSRVRLMDLFPTIAEICKMKTPNIHGKSFLSCVVSEDRQYVDYIFTEREMKNQKGRIIISVLKNNLKYIKTYPEEKMELYDLNTDPEEKANIAQKNPKIVATFQDLVQKHLNMVSETSKNVNVPLLKEEDSLIKERLAALGYID